MFPHKKRPRSKSKNWDDEHDSDSTSEYDPLRLAGKKAAEQHTSEAGPNASGAVAPTKEAEEMPMENNDADGQRHSKVTKYKGDAAITKRANTDGTKAKSERQRA